MLCVVCVSNITYIPTNPAHVVLTCSLCNIISFKTLSPVLDYRSDSWSSSPGGCPGLWLRCVPGVLPSARPHGLGPSPGTPALLTPSYFRVCSVPASQSLHPSARVPPLRSRSTYQSVYQSKVPATQMSTSTCDISFMFCTGQNVAQSKTRF